MGKRKKSLDNAPEKKHSKGTQQSPGEQKKNSRKKLGHAPSGGKSVQQTRVTFQKPLTVGVLEHVESCMETAMLSVMSRKISLRQVVQGQLTSLTQRFLRQCKNAKFPSTKLNNLKSLKKNVLQEQRITEELEETMHSLDCKLEKAVENAQTAKDSILLLEEKIENLEQEASGSDTINVITSKANGLQLPKVSYTVPTMQDNFQNLKNPSMLLEELCVIQSTPAAVDLCRIIEKSYSVIDAM
ncbi:uncharacterized protein LOC134575482 [Pelobates fuscus]|uniref:uncharacterized protein LOC134575482 n=1 Tax=Pelobates fuscus TaxID=191477 RepID=UPI002FE487DF